MRGTFDLRSDGIARVRLEEQQIERDCVLIGQALAAPDGGTACVPSIECPPCEGDGGCHEIFITTAAVAETSTELINGSLATGTGPGSFYQCDAWYRYALWRTGEATP